MRLWQSAICTLALVGTNAAWAAGISTPPLGPGDGDPQFFYGDPLDPPITYTEQATVSGSIGGKSFTNTLITLMMNGDTSTVIPAGPGFFQNTTGTFTFNIAGIGSGTFTEAMDVFDNQVFNPPAAGFGATVGGSLLDTFNAAFGSYNLTTSIGPITGSSFIRPDLTFSTSLGGLVLTTAGNATFTASTVPEPSSYLLLGTVALGLAYRLRSKQA